MKKLVLTVRELKEKKSLTPRQDRRVMPAWVVRRTQKRGSLRKVTVNEVTLSPAPGGRGALWYHS